MAIKNPFNDQLALDCFCIRVAEDGMNHFRRFSDKETAHRKVLIWLTGKMIPAMLEAIDDVFIPYEDETHKIDKRRKN